MDFSKITIADFKNYFKYFRNRIEHLNEFRRLIYTIETYLEYEVKDIKSVIKISSDTPNDIKELYELIFAKKDYSFEFENIKNEINQNLFLLIKFSNENNIFFNCCSDLVYKNTFDNRFNDFKENYFNDDLKDFVSYEYQNDNFYFEYEKSELLSKKNKKILEKFKENKIHFINSLYKNEFKNQQPDFEAIDLSDKTATEKIIYLHKLGVIDFLREQEPFKYSINSLATVLSAVTGEKSGTIQPMINPMLSEFNDQKNNPLNSKKAVPKVEQQLIKIGFKLK